MIRVLNVEIDGTNGCVRRDGQEFSLRPKTLQVLLTLVEHRLRVVSKEELFATVWQDTAVSDDTLVGCIQEIRKALGDDARSPRFIATRPKVGYRFLPAPEVSEKALPELAATPPAPAASLEPETPPQGRRPFPYLAAAAIVLALSGLVFAGIRLARNQRPPAKREADVAEVAWWKFDDQGKTAASDSSGHGLSGKISGSAQWEPGVLGSALRLNGVDTAVRGLDTQGVLPRGDASRSISAWVKTTTTNGDLSAILHYGEGLSKQDSFHLHVRPGGEAGFGHWSDAYQGSGLAMADRVDDGNWRHVVGVFYGSGLNQAVLYVDGVERASTSMVMDHLDPHKPTGWSIGNFLISRTPFRGSIDDVRVYERPLTAGQVAALYRCASGQPDIQIPGYGDHYFLPVFDLGGPGKRVNYTTIERPGRGETSASFWNSGKDYAGIQFARKQNDCSAVTLRGADIGQDLYMSVEVTVPSDVLAQTTQAGPYFRGRSAGAGDGLVGPVSTGYWVQLHSTGMVTLKNLWKPAMVAFTKAIPGFQGSEFHRIEIAAKGEQLQVALDGRLLTFDQAGVLGASVHIPPDWDGPNREGKNQGRAGVAMSSESARRLIGGQHVRNISVGPYHTLN